MTISVPCSADRSALGALLIVVLEIAGEQLYFSWGRHSNWWIEQLLGFGGQGEVPCH